MIMDEIIKHDEGQVPVKVKLVYRYLRQEVNNDVGKWKQRENRRSTGRYRKSFNVRRP